jgi:hypothetical protein
VDFIEIAKYSLKAKKEIYQLAGSQAQKCLQENITKQCYNNLSREQKE